MDPKRPLFAPAALKDLQKPGAISGYSWETSDDGKLAIAEFTARGKSALRPILADPRVVKKFGKGKERNWLDWTYTRA